MRFPNISNKRSNAHSRFILIFTIVLFDYLGIRRKLFDALKPELSFGCTWLVVGMYFFVMKSVDEAREATSTFEMTIGEETFVVVKIPSVRLRHNYECLYFFSLEFCVGYA